MRACVRVTTPDETSLTYFRSDPRVSSVTAVVRSPKNTKFWADEGQSSDKIRVVVVPDFDNLRDHEAAFAGHDVFISCLGIYTHQAKSEEHFMSVRMSPIEAARTH